MKDYERELHNAGIIKGILWATLMFCLILLILSIKDLVTFGVCK